MNQAVVIQAAAQADCNLMCALDEEVCLLTDANLCNRVIACMHES